MKILKKCRHCDQRKAKDFHRVTETHCWHLIKLIQNALRQFGIVPADFSNACLLQTCTKQRQHQKLVEEEVRVVGELVVARMALIMMLPIPH